MLRPTAIKVEHQNDYKLLLEFDNNEKRLFDVKPYIRGEWFSELLDKNYFRAVTINGCSVEWPHGQDLCPDELYYTSVMA